MASRAEVEHLAEACDAAMEASAAAKNRRDVEAVTVALRAAAWRKDGFRADSGYAAQVHTALDAFERRQREAEEAYAKHAAAFKAWDTATSEASHG